MKAPKTEKTKMITYVLIFKIPKLSLNMKSEQNCDLGENKSC